MKTNELPPMETMLEDLAKVPGLDFFWSTLALAASLDGLDYVLTEREKETVAKASRPDPC